MNEYGSTTYKGSVNKGFADSWRKRLEEEEKLRAQAEMEAAEVAAAQQKEEDDKPWNEKAGKWLGEAAQNVGNFVKDAAVDVYKTGENAFKGISDVVEGQVAVNEESDRVAKEGEIVSKNSKRLQDAMGADYDNPDSAKWDSPEIKKIIDESNKELEEFRNANKDKREGARQQMEESQNVDATKVAADSAETFLNVATLGTGTTLKAGAKAGIKQGVKQLTKQGGKDIAKAVVKGAGEGAVFGGAAGLTDSISEGKTPEQAVENVARQAAFGGIIGGAASGVPKAFGVKKNNKAVAAQTAKQAADDAAMSQIDDVAARAADDLDNPLRDIPDDELKTQLDDILEGRVKSDDIEGTYKQVQQITDELNNREATNYFANGGRKVEDVKKAIDELDAGTNIPESAYKTATPVTSVDDVLARKDIPLEIKNAATEISQDKKMINQQMEGLMSPEVKADELARLNDQYALQLRELNQRYGDPLNPGSANSDVRFQRAKELLDEDYKNATSELDMLEAQDFDEVQKYQSMLDTIATREQNIVGDTRTLMRAAPDRFRDIDEVELGARRAELEEELVQAQRFTDRKNIIETNSQAPDPVKNVETKPEVREAVTQEAVEEVSKIPSQFKSHDQSLAVMKALSPSQWFQKRGLRGGVDGKGENLHANIIKGLSATNKANLEDTKVLATIKKILPGNKEAQIQIVDYIEGNRKTLSAIGDQDAAKQIQAFLDGKRKELTDIGLATRDDYFPHIWDKSDPKVQEMFTDRATGEINFNNVKARIAEADDYSKDIMDVLSQYTGGVNRKIHLEPALKPLSDLKTQVAMTAAESKYIDAYINQLKGLNKSDLQRGVNKGLDDLFSKMGVTKGLVGSDHYTKVLSTQRMISAVAAMGFNPGTIIRNGTQAVNTVADLGPRYATIGAFDGTRMLATKEGLEELRRVGVIDGGVSQNFTDLLEDATVKGKLTKGRDKAVWAMMAGIRGTDIMLRTQAYAGAKALAKAKGLTGEAAENFAINKVVDTQFMTSVVDMPVAFNGQGVRSFTQLATFSGKQAGFLKRMGVKVIKGADGKGFQLKDAGAVLSGIATMAIMTEALKPLIGFNEKEWVPFYDQIAPFLAPITGDDSSSGESLYRSPLLRLLIGDGKSKDGIMQALQSIGKEDEDGNVNDLGDAWNTFWEDNWSSIVPAGTQIKKSTEGFGTTSEGVSRNSSGNIRYQQDQSGDENVNTILGMKIDPQLQATLFGQYSTRAGQNWIREGFPTLSEKQTQNVDAQTSEQAKAQYIDFYQARKKASGRQNAYDQVKTAAKAGDLNKAARLAAEYNEKVKEAMADYYREHDNLPQELRDELTNDLYINVNKVRKNVDEE